MLESARIAAIRLIEQYEPTLEKPYFNEDGSIVIGVGHDIVERGLHSDVIRHQFHIDIQEAKKDCYNVFPSFGEYSERMQIVFLSMAFSLGRAKLLGMPGVIEAAEIGDIGEISKEMMKTEWAKNKKHRCYHMVNILKGGVL